MSACSIHDSFYRAVVLHGTHEVLVDANVVYNVRGSAIYLEDGVEERNTVSFNFVAFVLVLLEAATGTGQAGIEVVASDAIAQPADVAAAGFYITNAQNTFVGNAASGGWTGFSFPNLPQAVGLHASQGDVWPTNPAQRPTRLFYANSAHSSGYHWNRGSCMYVGGRLTQDDAGVLTYLSGRDARHTQSSAGEPMWMSFTHCRVWLCRRGINHWGNRCVRAACCSARARAGGHRPGELFRCCVDTLPHPVVVCPSGLKSTITRHTTCTSR